jgi:hypothetical protein
MLYICVTAVNKAKASHAEEAHWMHVHLRKRLLTLIVPSLLLVHHDTTAIPPTENKAKASHAEVAHWMHVHLRN